MAFQVSILTLYPEMFPGFLGYSMAGRALDHDIWSLDTIQIRDFAFDRHHSVDDTPAGGGAGMVMKADVLAHAIDSVDNDFPRLLMSPRGRPFGQKMAHELKDRGGVTLICGRFEGVDERVIVGRNLIEVSVGDYILSGGEGAALIVLDSIIRLLPGVMGNIKSAEQESFESGLLEYPQYTRPQIFEGKKIPDILTSGNHQAIEQWRKNQAEEITRKRRPDLYSIYEKVNTKA
ncbi:tRNA (guanosine(37)-N1)-methyltransferase TrmD [uncultured Bartonella sp.]|uniref:tRNA (guanosine(37)-N1)-methyltransferase TrmD n=1 Tax=uncultured Bartonella sp. TaxID=104108 RepID=UPI002619FE97|nr:tRNA (guanosine(37)-N1)-methyltransferase TrmD [uncultured Bartonella sp.]